MKPSLLTAFMLRPIKGRSRGEARSSSVRAVFGAVSVVLIAIGMLFAGAAQASKQAVDFFGGTGTLGGQFTSADATAVNDSGAGPADAGDIYALDASNNRIERFGRDDNGTPGTTPAATADDTYFFISAWGADVDATPSGGSDYEICTVAADCQPGVASAGNGTAAGNGALSAPRSLALDQDTGQLYVSDTANNRVNVYAGDGAFLRSFGYDVVAGNVGTGYEVCVAADGDVCKAGLGGAAAGQIGTLGGSSGARGIAVSAPDGNSATGTVFLADAANRRVDTYALDGTSPSSFGSTAQFPFDSLLTGHPNQPSAIAVDSRGIVYIGAGGGNSDFGAGDYRIERYDSANANGGGVGFLAPIASPQNEEQRLSQKATAGQFRLSFDPDGAGPQPAETTPAPGLPFDARGSQISAALEALPSIGAGNVHTIDDNLGYQLTQISFQGALAATDLAQLVVSNGTTPLTGSITASTAFDGHGGLAPGAPVFSLAVDPDTDGGGPDTDVLYAERGSTVFQGPNHIQQFGPANPPGLTAPPSAVDDVHNANNVNLGAQGLAIEPSTGRLYAAAAGGVAGNGVYVLDETGPPPTVTPGPGPCDNITSNSADCHATIDPNGPPATRYHFDYVDDATFQADLTAGGAGHGFDHAKSLSEVFLGAQEDPQAVTGHLEPPPIGLDPNTLYHVRVVAGRKFADPVISNELTFTTAPAPPLAETTGAPVRTTTTAQLGGRVTPLGTAATYHFDYGSAGPCDANPCDSTPPVGAGSGQLTRLASAQIDNLDPDTTYHYRIVADNGVGSPVPGDDFTVHTRASDQLPGQSDEFPGPPGSDRAWELVSIADSSGNPVNPQFTSDAFSDAGDRAVYAVAGGTPISVTGSLFNLHFAERTPNGWQSRQITPPRDQLVGDLWNAAMASPDLSTITVRIFETGNVGGGQLWRLSPVADPVLLSETSSSTYGLSLDGSRVVDDGIGGAPDPAYPAAVEQNVYDLSSASPKLVSLLPGDQLAPCGASLSYVFRGSHRVSDDGARVLFDAQPATPCGGSTPAAQLYLRDLLAGQTKLVSGPPLSGPDCGAGDASRPLQGGIHGGLINATPSAVFFATASRLDPSDLAPNANCSSSKDVYRYDLATGALDCVTCVIPGFNVEVDGSGAGQIAVSDDGARVYFPSNKRLLAGALPDGERSVYRVDVGSGELAYVGPFPSGGLGNMNASTEISADGSILAFSSANASLNPLGATTDNGGTRQDYRYDDTDRSLICLSCPQDGSPPLAAVNGQLHADGFQGLNNQRSLSTDGGTFAFATPTPLLVGADQNTPGPGGDPARGTDVYEWRDGRLLLVTDGQTSWDAEPGVRGIGPTGNDIYFDASAAYTPDALDTLTRLYDARIGGGFHFPPPGLPLCNVDLGECEGAGTSAPDRPGAGSGAIQGPGNPPVKFPKTKKKHHKKHKHKAKHRNHHRRAHR